MKRIISFMLTLCASALYGAPSFNIDYAVFRVGDAALLQVYTTVQRNSLQFLTADSGVEAKFNIVVSVNRGDSSLASVTDDRTDAVASRDQISPAHRIPLESSFQITPGDFTIEVLVTDKASGESRRKELKTTVPQYGRDNIDLSDIEFGMSVSPANTSGAFIKKQTKVIPDADRIYGGGFSTIYYYLEVYNLAATDRQAEYRIIRKILDGSGNVFKAFPEKSLAQRASSVTEIDSLSVADFPFGSYKLQMSVIDGITNQIAERSKSFWIYDTASIAALASGGATPELTAAIENLSPAEATREIEYIQYMTSLSDNRIIDKLKPEGHREFLLSFWRKNDPSGMMRYRYLARIKAADERFSTTSKNGWRTDRGRVLILYGEPSSVDRMSFELGAPDSEVWYYDQVDGGVMFYFTDLKGTGDLQQVYSSKSGEYIDIGWVQETEYRYDMPIQDVISNRPKLIKGLER